MISTSIVMLIISLVVMAMVADFMNNQRVYYKHKYEDLERENMILKTMISKIPRVDFRDNHLVDETFDKDDDDEDD